MSSILRFEDLQEATGYKRMSDVEKCLRLQNIRVLKWEDVDFDNWTLAIRETKNGQPRNVPVVGMAQRTLQAHHDRDPTQEGWVFKGYRDGGLPAGADARRCRRPRTRRSERHCRYCSRQRQSRPATRRSSSEIISRPAK